MRLHISCIFTNVMASVELALLTVICRRDELTEEHGVT